MQRREGEIDRNSASFFLSLLSSSPPDSHERTQSPAVPWRDSAIARLSAARRGKAPPRPGGLLLLRKEASSSGASRRIFFRCSFEFGRRQKSTNRFYLSERARTKKESLLFNRTSLLSPTLPFVACETPRRARPLLLPPVATLTTTTLNNETCLSSPPTAAIIISCDRSSSSRQTAAPPSSDRAPCLMRVLFPLSIAARAEEEEELSSSLVSA